MRSQTFSFLFEVPPEVVYRAMLDPQLLSRWRVPDNMKMEIHCFEANTNGKFRISLTYDDHQTSGKSGPNTDTYHGYFKTLVPNRQIIEVIEFESKGSEFAGEMIITTDLYPENGGTKLVATHENLPAEVPADQNELGWKMSLTKLAHLLQG